MPAEASRGLCTVIEVPVRPRLRAAIAESGTPRLSAGGEGGRAIVRLVASRQIGCWRRVGFSGVVVHDGPLSDSFLRAMCASGAGPTETRRGQAAEATGAVRSLAWLRH